MSFLTNFLLGKKGPNPSDSAMPYLQQIPAVGHQYYDPYINQGQQQGQAAGQTYGQMGQKPNEFLNNIFSNYEPSKGYQFQKDQMLQAARNSAASGGFAGTNYDQQGQAQLVQSLLGGDMQQFLQNILGIQGQGLQGQQHQADIGYGASSNLADMLGGTLNAQGGLAFQGQSQQNTNNLARRMALLNFVSNTIGSRGEPGKGS